MLSALSPIPALPFIPADSSVEVATVIALLFVGGGHLTWATRAMLHETLSVLNGSTGRRGALVLLSTGVWAGGTGTALCVLLAAYAVFAQGHGVGQAQAGPFLAHFIQAKALLMAKFPMLKPFEVLSWLTLSGCIQAVFELVRWGRDWPLRRARRRRTEQLLASLETPDEQVKPRRRSPIRYH